MYTLASGPHVSAFIITSETFGGSAFTYDANGTLGINYEHDKAEWNDTARRYVDRAIAQSNRVWANNCSPRPLFSVASISLEWE